MNENSKTWLLALVMGIVLPGVMFSVAEKMHPLKPPENANMTTAETVVQNNTVSEPYLDSVTVLQANGNVSKMDMDSYLVGVLLGEMPAEFDEEALKAQAVVARTYALKRSVRGEKHIEGAVCTASSCCQSYCSIENYLQKGGTQQAVDKVSQAVACTTGQVLTYQGSLIEATYFSCSGGRTEDAVAVWGTDIPYLQAVESPGEEQAIHYADHIKMSVKEFAECLGIQLSGSPTSWFGSVSYTAGGGVDTIVIAGKTFEGVFVRQKLGLYSTAFTVMAAGDTVHIYTKGFGHRVGMSQYGAEAMAVGGSKYTQILYHYYPGTKLDNYLEN